ncbi:hypothetical protein CRE_31259 [Caenorhabditis remanei]|uniref:Uncharacterized protein n=1 Tax=Caenorhabditis remanei TaxID=31234 RepID=E3MLG9_CAERE|nr:hypothetical protein CRE_31259 [Caenorhabditis remanei]
MKVLVLPLILSSIAVLNVIGNGKHSSQCCIHPNYQIIHEVNVSEWDFDCDEPVQIKCNNINFAADLVGIAGRRSYKENFKVFTRNPKQCVRNLTCAPFQGIWTEPRKWIPEGRTDGFFNFACAFKKNGKWQFFED